MLITKQERIWNEIVKRGPVHCREIAERLGFSAKEVKNAMENMRRRMGDQLIIKGRAHATTYEAIPGGRYTCIGAGRHPNSLANLSRPQDRAQRLSNLVPGWKPVRPRPAIALEQRWGWGLGKTDDHSV